MHPSSERFHELLEELGDLHDRKQSDYGTDDDPFYNLRASTAFGLEPWVGAMVRLNDKINRVQSFIRKGELANESLEDSLRDIAVYAVIAQVLLEEAQARRQQPRPSLANRLRKLFTRKKKKKPAQSHWDIHWWRYQ